jgi:Tfp pilus assembly protein PilO
VIDASRVDRFGRIAVALVLVVSSALAAHRAIRPLYGTRHSLGSFREAIGILATADGSVDRLDGEIRAVADEIRRSRSMLPTDLNLDAFLEEVGEIARTTGTRIVALAPQPPAEHRLFRELELEVRVTGSYPSIRDFLSRLEDGNQLSRVEQLQMAKAGAGDQITASVRLALYFAPDARA